MCMGRRWDRLVGDSLRGGSERSMLRLGRRWVRLLGRTSCRSLGDGNRVVASCLVELVVGSLESGIWNLDFGVWSLDLAISEARL